MPGPIRTEPNQKAIAPNLGIDYQIANQLLQKCVSENRNLTIEDMRGVLGSQSLIALNASLESVNKSIQAFSHWYRYVLEPIGVDRVSACKLYTGNITPLEFASNLDEETCDHFLNEYPKLSSEYFKSQGMI